MMNSERRQERTWMCANYIPRIATNRWNKVVPLRNEMSGANVFVPVLGGKVLLS